MKEYFVGYRVGNTLKCDSCYVLANCESEAISLGKSMLVPCLFSWEKALVRWLVRDARAPHSKKKKEGGKANG